MANKRLYARIWKAALKAGEEAGKECVPRPIIVGDADLQGNMLPTGKKYYVPQGVCGFAWVIVRPGTSSFARWMRKYTNARTAYRGGTQHWIRFGGQSYEIKMAYAYAMAGSLQDALKELDPKIDIQSGGRLD